MDVLLMEEILDQLRLVVYPIIYQVYQFPGKFRISYIYQDYVYMVTFHSSIHWDPHLYFFRVAVFSVHIPVLR